MNAVAHFTVTQLTAAIKRLLEGDPDLRDVWLEGEVSNFTRAPSGHCYFTLKDPGSAISCVMWQSNAQWLARLPANGDQVLALGSVSMYEKQGRVQFYVERVEPAGLGRLYQELEALKARLASEGLFDDARKRPLPAWPRAIGVVTSPKAAALRDILRTLAARYPLAEVLLAPATVQGAEAPAQIAAAIELLNHWALGVEPIDLIIVARGGGSLEELWAFNDERVVRAIVASTLPVISGVGHETDFTLADFAADQRAPTPTGAAAAAVPDQGELRIAVAGLWERAAVATNNWLAVRRQLLAQANRSLERASPERQIVSHRQQVDDLVQAGMARWRHVTALRRAELAGWQARLLNLDPQAVLSRGYAVVSRQDDGQVVSSVEQVKAGTSLKVLVHDGEFDATVS